MKLDKHVIDMFTELTKPSDDVKMEKTCYGTISVVDGTRYVKLDGSDLLVPAASTVKTSHGDRVTVLMKNHSLTVTGNLTAPATDGGGSSSGEAGTAATIEVGTVTTGEAGSSASVTNVGTKSEAIFDFVIPKGDKGDKGDTGPQGPQGEKGDTGTWDGTIPDHEHTVSDITDFPTSLPANGGNADTVGAKSISQILAVKGWFDGDMDNLKEQGSYIVNAATNMPIPGGWGTALVYIGGTGSVVQVFTAYVTSASDLCKTYIRHFTGDLWSTWVNIADGGNADTLDGLHANEIASNPNLLDNPDFKINQRGLTSYSYTTNGYTVDRWKINSNAKLTVNDGFVTFENTTKKGTVTLYQIVENPAAFSGKTVTLSFDYDLKSEGASITIQAFANNSWTPPVAFNSTGRSVKSKVITLPENLTDLRWVLVIHSTDSAPLAIVDVYGAKLELGKIATPIIPVDSATELAKCQRYYASHFVVKNGFYGTAYTDRANCARLTVALPATTRKLPTIVYTADNLVLFDGINRIGITALEVHTNMGNQITLSVIAEELTVGTSYLLLATDNTTIAYSAEL